VGTGKEVLARAIHAQSHRRNHAFVSVDLRATPPEALEALLFGQVPGKLGERRPARRGLFVEAHRGTLYLDEVTKLPLDVQSALLRAIQEKEICPLGDTKAIAVDTRIIAASRCDLEAEVAAGRFQPELWARLDATHLHAPALRDRRDDIPLLLDYFLARARDTSTDSIRSISDEALECLTRYRWPGNIRELESVSERAALLASGGRITLQDLPYDVVGGADLDSDSAAPRLSLKRARRAFEAHVIQRALAQCEGNRTHAARLLEISHRALLYKMKEYGLRD